MKLPENFKIGLTLSGGASYGMAHIGVIKALREYGIEPEVLYGTSAGAIVAVLYASGASIREMRAFAQGNQLTKMIRWRVPRLGFLPLDHLENKISEYIPLEYLEDLPRKVIIGGTNLETGRHEDIETGPLTKAVAASCAIPVFFKPVEVNGHIFVDGGVSNNMPAFALKKHCDFIIGSDVVEAGPVDRGKIRGFKRLLERTMTISLANRTILNYKDCDFVVQPVGMIPYGKFDFSRVDEFVEMGYHHMIQDLPELLDVLYRKILEKEKLAYESLNQKSI